MKTLSCILVAVVVFVGVSVSSAAAAQPGAIDGDIKDESGQLIIRYAGVVPPRLPAHKLFGLILGLHGKGGDERQQVGPISKALAANGLAGGYMVLGLKSKAESWEDQDIEPVSKAIAWAIKEYPVDPRRVYAWGFSSGAFFAGKFVPRHPELLTAGVVQSGGVWSPPRLEEGGEPPVQLYLIHGEKDEMVAVKTARDSCEHLADANYRFVYHELTGDGHGLSGPGGDPARQDAVRFLNALRNRAIPLSEAERKILDDLSAKLKTGKFNPPNAAYLPLLSLAGPETDAAVALTLRSGNPEVRLNGVSLCVQRLYGQPVMTGLAELLKDKDAKIRFAAIRALGMAADFQHKDAVDALSALARDSSAPVKDRLHAAGQMGISLALQLQCVNRQKDMFAALTDLLEDKNSQIKQLARVSLDGKLTFDGQGYQVQE